MRSAGVASLVVVASYLCVYTSCFSVPAGATLDHFVFTQFWPQSQCHSASLLQDGRPFGVANDNCVPPGVTNWTIHGLWPDGPDQEPNPQFCNKSWPFNMTEIEDLKPQLLIHWPTYVSGSPERFWKHEWEKHGTCATSLKPLNSEHKYFSTGLALNAHIDLHSGLASVGIHPTNTAVFEVKDVEMAMFNVYGAHARVVCEQGKEGIQLLSSIEMCLDKGQLKAIDCHNTTAITCDYSKNVHYPPIIQKFVEV